MHSSHSRNSLLDKQIAMPSAKTKQISKGFTLIEVIIGIVVFAVSLSLISPLFDPAEQNSADQIHQIKASELGQSLMDDIMSRAFDENSDKTGGLLRCDEDQDTSGTVEADEQCSNTLGTDSGETTRSLFDDVDDFDGYNQLINATDTALDSGYNSFTVLVAVIYDGDSLSIATRLAKRITITVTTPLGTAIEFTVLKANF